MAIAQKLTAEKMELAPLDYSASQYKRLDTQGTPCALVKVQMAVQGADFSGAIVGAVENKMNEYWVYMPMDSYKLSVKTPDFLPLEINFRDLMDDRHFSVKSLATYKLVIVIPEQKATTAENEPPSTSGMENNHEWIDLGLSVLWATMNIGANTSGDYGDYYAWGEKITKDDYNMRVYKHGNYNQLTKYCTDPQIGVVDNKTSLDLSDDVANAKWGGKRRMPTYEEVKELKEECSWTTARMNGHKGYRVTGPNGNSIFLPAAGFRYDTKKMSVGQYGLYWSSSLNVSEPKEGLYLKFGDLGKIVHTQEEIIINRSVGGSVRPVKTP
jgi:hypothetical protein